MIVAGLLALLANPAGASVGIGPPPSNDQFANAIPLTGSTIQTSGSNFYATKEPLEPDHAGNPGGSSVWWTWTAEQAGYLRISTCLPGPLDSELDTLLAVYTGNSLSRLRLVAENDDHTDYGGLEEFSGYQRPGSTVSFAVIAGQTYHIAVDGYSELGGPAEAGSIGLALTFSTERPPAPRGTGPAADWALPDLDGGTVGWTRFTNQVVLMNFWTTWCGDCVDEIPHLTALQRKYGPDGLSVVGISLDEQGGLSQIIPLLKGFVQDHSVNYPVLVSNHTVNQIFNIGGIPATYVVDRRNEIVQRLIGLQKYATLERIVKPLLYEDLRVHILPWGGRLRLHWPVTQASFSLWSTTDVVDVAWTIETAPVQSDALGLFADVPFTAQRTYFCLRSP